MAHARRPRGSSCSRRVRRARCMRASDTAGGGVARAGHLCERTAAVAARSAAAPAASSRQACRPKAALWRRCGSAVTCVGTANGAGSVVGDEGGRRGRRGGGGGGIRPHNGHTHGHTCAHVSIFACAADLARAAVPTRGEAGGGGDGGSDDARDVGRRAEAAAAPRCVRGGACERGSSRHGQRAASRMRREGSRVRAFLALRTF